MLEYMFKAFLVTSLVGAVVTLFLVIIKPLTRKFLPSSWHYYMWLLVLVTMIMPVKITVPIDTGSTTQTNTEYALNEQIFNFDTIKPVDEVIIDAENEIRLDNSNENLRYFNQEILHLSSMVWFLVVIVLLVVKLVGYAMFLLKLRKYSTVISFPEIAKYTDRKIITRTSDIISSPMMVGLFKPTLVLPKTAMTEEQLDNILMHEFTHYKRKDIWYKWFMTIVKSIHWFNPAVYYISKQAEIECETSCDLAVVKEMSEEQEINYINTILTLLVSGNRRKTALTTGMTSDMKTLKRRFTMIKNKVKFNKKTFVISIFLAIVIIIVTIIASGFINGKFLNNYENELLILNTDERNNDNFNVLVLGVDETNRADTIMYLSFEDGSVKVTSIPRDAAFISEYYDRQVKLSELLNSDNGNQKVIDAVRDTLGIPITYYVKSNLSAVRKIVDIVGGIELDIPSDMQYDDPYKDLHINLKKGRQTLNGDEVCGLLQYRRSNNGEGYSQGDLTRIEVGQQFVSEFIKQKLNKEFINKLSGVIKIISENIETNYPVSILIDDIDKFEKTKSSIEFSTIDGGFIQDDTGVLFYDTENGEIVSTVSEPVYSPNSHQNSVNVVEENNIESDFENPVVGEISRTFGKREHPITKEVHEHNGIDIKAEEGTDVVASISGVVTEVGFDAEKGNYVVVENGNVKTSYSQLETVKVSNGDNITQKQLIGTVGKTGNATGAHLHFEVMVNGEYYDPESLIKH